MIPIEMAIYILTHRGKYWSHEISDAEKVCIEACKILVMVESPTFGQARKEINDILKEENYE